MILGMGGARLAILIVHLVALGWSLCLTICIIYCSKDYESHATSFKCKVTCPHGCKKKISRAEWADHEKECPDKIVPCAAY